MTSARLKYNNKPKIYNGRKYQSTKEADYAMNLDWRIKAGEVTKWVPQVKIELVVNGSHIVDYFIDFMVELSDGSVEYHEVKGMELEVWRIKWDLTKAIYPDMKLVLIK